MTWLWNNNAALRTRPNPAVAVASEIWSVDIQGNGGGGFNGQVNPPVLMSGVEPTSGIGNIWNAFTVAGHTGNASGVSVNPALANLKDSAGTTSGIGFAITGTVSGYSTASGSGLTADYLFLNAGFSAASQMGAACDRRARGAELSVPMAASPLRAPRNPTGALPASIGFNSPESEVLDETVGSARGALAFSIHDGFQ